MQDSPYFATVEIRGWLNPESNTIHVALFRGDNIRFTVEQCQHDQADPVALDYPSLKKALSGGAHPCQHCFFLVVE